MTDGQICYQNKHCTNCPIRSRCNIRPKFYSEVDFSAWIEETKSITLRISSMMGLPEQASSFGINKAIEMMNERRRYELKEHPVFSPK